MTEIITPTMQELVAGIKETCAKTRPSYGEKTSRTLEGRAVLRVSGELHTELVLSVSHWKERKVFMCGLSVVTVGPVFTRHSLMDQRYNARLPYIPVARFSEPALTNAWLSSLAHFAAHAEELTAGLDLGMEPVD